MLLPWPMPSPPFHAPTNFWQFPSSSSKNRFFFSYIPGWVVFCWLGFFCLIDFSFWQPLQNPEPCLRNQVPAWMLQGREDFRVVSQASVISEIWEAGLYHIVLRIQSQKWKRKEQLAWEAFHSKGRSKPQRTPSTHQGCKTLRPPISLGAERGASRAGRTIVQCTSRCIPNSPKRRELLGKTQPNDHYFQEHK